MPRPSRWDEQMPQQWHGHQFSQMPQFDGHRLMQLGQYLPFLQNLPNIPQMFTDIIGGIRNRDFTTIRGLLDEWPSYDAPTRNLPPINTTERV